MIFQLLLAAYTLECLVLRTRHIVIERRGTNLMEAGLAKVRTSFHVLYLPCIEINVVSMTKLWWWVKALRPRGNRLEMSVLESQMSVLKWQSSR